MVGGVVPTAQIPAIAITEFLGSVANQTAMLALVGQVGDWCIRTDEQYGYVIIGSNPTLITDWQKIVTPASPVTSVNGQVGTVVLSASDVGAPSGSGSSTGTNTGDETNTTIKTKLGSASASTDGYLTSIDWSTFNAKQNALGFTPVPNTRLISTTSPLSGGGDLSADRTLSIQDAAADGTTKGASTFTANDFNATSGVISLDYTNGQSASTTNKGYLTNTDWNTFNNKSRIQFNNSTGVQSISANTVTYITGTAITNANLQAGTTITWEISVTKTAAGTAAPIFTIRFGTGASTSDSTLITITGNAQTAAADTGVFTIKAVLRTVGSGTSAVMASSYSMVHSLATTGLSNGGGGVYGLSSGFNSTTSNAFFGVAVNSGASASWQVNQVFTKIENIL